MDLQNEDNTTHQVKVVEGTNIVVFSIKPNSMERAVCEAICSIELGGDVLGAVGETVVTIKGGKLQGQSQLCLKQVCTPKGCETDYYPAPRCPVQPSQESTNSPTQGKRLIRRYYSTIPLTLVSHSINSPMCLFSVTGQCFQFQAELYC